MIQVGTLLKVTDKTGVNLVKCIKVLGSSKNRIANLGDLVLVSIRQVNPKKLRHLKLFKRKRFSKGRMHRALVVRTKVFHRRSPNVFIKFNENSVVLVNRRKVPISNRVYGPVLRELCMKYPSLGCMTRMMI
jgi:large subunit ribosomal protein L14